ncbi:hypothetical protein [Parapedomonas caeni]
MRGRDARAGVDAMFGAANPMRRLLGAVDGLIRDWLADALVGSGERARHLTPAEIDWLAPALRGVLLGWVAAQLINVLLDINGLGELAFLVILALSLRRKLAGLLKR